MKHRFSTETRTHTGLFGIVKWSGLFLFTLLLLNCSGSDDQREFEQHAYQAPEGFTETDGNGNLIEGGNVDPDDWQISPFFQGLVVVDPAFPNPVQTTDDVSLMVEITGIESVSGLVLYAWFHESGTRRLVDEIQQSPMDPGLHILRFAASQLSEFDSPESARGLKRVILMDRNEEIISFGDIMVE